ncbi:MAG: hypothetical protein H0V53_06170 [Rubrobacter sp.]|nr:hypothetical protein [Rubrobacter sp.]
MILASLFILAVAVALLILSVGVVGEHERAVVFRLGRVSGGPRGPGVVFVLPLADRVERVQVQPSKAEVRNVGLTTREGGLLEVSAAVHYRVADPVASLMQTRDPGSDMQRLLLQSLRSLAARRELWHPFEHRQEFEEELHRAFAGAGGEPRGRGLPARGRAPVSLARCRVVPALRR